MIYLFVTIHVIVCVFLILVVLLQQGKGADLSVFGGGSTMTAFGARGAATLLHKLTVGSFIAFIVTTMAIAVLQGSKQTSTVMEDEEAAVEPAPATEPAAPAQTAEPASAPAAADPAGSPADTAAPAEGVGGEAAAPEAAPSEPAPAAEQAPPPSGGQG